MKRFLLKSAVFVTVLMFISTVGFACSYSTPRIEVRPSFRVKVNSSGISSSGVRVVLEHTEMEPKYTATVAYSATTDNNGVAQFADIAVGEYVVAIDQLGNNGIDTATIVVSPGHPPNDVEVKWPSYKILVLGKVSGTLLHASSTKPVASIGLRLIGGFNRRLVSMTTTDDSGH